MSEKATACPLPLNMQYGTVSAALKVPSYKLMVNDTGVYELYFLCVILQLCHQCLQAYLQFKKNTARIKVYRYLYFSLWSCSAHPLPLLCGLSDLLVNSCGCSKLCLCYWKHSSKSAISHDVQMIGCVVFGYPFSNTGHDWRELPRDDDEFAL